MATNTMPAGLTAEVAGVLDQVEKLLALERPAEALERLRRAGAASPWLANAAGVCRLRLGDSNAAIALFRPLAVAPGGLFLQQDAPPVFLVNLAAALVADGNLGGGLRTLGEIRDGEHPAVREARDAARRWQDRMTFWQRLWWSLGGSPPWPLALQMPPGRLR